MKNRKEGFGLVEILVCASLITLVGVSAVTAWNQYLKITNISTKLTKAALLTEEAGEALIVWRDQSWTAMIKPLTLNFPYYLYWNGASYATSTGAVAFQDNYTVAFTLSSVRRDSNSNIVASGGSIDADTLKATLTVAPLNATTTPISTSELLIQNAYSN